MESPYAKTIARATLPEILFEGDVAVALDLSPDEAEAAIRAGEVGPFFEFRGRLALLRESFLAHLEAQARRPDGRGAIRILPRDGRGGQALTEE
jgi:hypothetical protein